MVNVIKPFFAVNLKNLKFPVKWSNKNRPFKNKLTFFKKKMGDSRPLFLNFRLFNTVDIYVQYKNLPMTGFELLVSGVGSDRSSCWATVQLTVFSKGPILASFCLFSFFSHYNFNTNWKKHRWCAWDSNPGPQDGRRRRNHGAMAATVKLTVLD